MLFGGASGPRILLVSNCCGCKGYATRGEVHKAKGGEVGGQSSVLFLSPPRPPSSTTTTNPPADYQPSCRLPTSPPPTYLLVYFVVAVCYQVSTFATVPSLFSPTHSFRFSDPSKSSLLAVLSTITDPAFQCSLCSLYISLLRFVLVPLRLVSTARSPSIL